MNRMRRLRHLEFMMLSMLCDLRVNVGGVFLVSPVYDEDDEYYEEGDISEYYIVTDDKL